MTKFLNPFPGLRPFEASESHLFFGRERHIDEILNKLTSHRFVSVVGNSGSGKSSLVRAGVLPKLTQDDSWEIRLMRPGENAIQHLGELVANEQSVSDRMETLNRNRLGLIQLVRSVLPKGKKLLLLVDQFEEIFRFSGEGEESGEDAHRFVDLLLAAIDQTDVPIYVMLTLRSDFLGDCEQFMGLPEAINDGQFLVPRMNREELQRSLTGPIMYVGAKISPRLVQLLLDEVGNRPDQLPILQHVLMRTWEVWEGAQNPNLPLDLEHYTQTGGMSHALSNHAEEAFATLKNDRQHQIAESLFKTITEKGPDNRGIRRPTNIRTIASIARCTEDEILDVAGIFRHPHQGFIMPPLSTPLTSESVLDISHESLMRVWDRLGNWVEEEAESAELYQRITESAMLYEQGKAGLWRDPDLQLALDWQEKNDPNDAWAGQYNTSFRNSIRFIEASLQEKKFVRAEKARRRKILNIASLAAVLVLAMLSIWALTERGRSIANAKEAEQGKQEAERQTSLAQIQKQRAEENFDEAQRRKKEVEEQQKLTEEQKSRAEAQAREAQIQREKALTQSQIAKEAEQRAVKDRNKAEKQKAVSDSLRIQAEASEKQATRLRVLSVAQNLAIKSKLADKNTYSQQVKSLLALQAYNFNKEFDGNPNDPEIFGALLSSLRRFQHPDEYRHKLHTNTVNSICYNPKGDLVSAGDDGQIILLTGGNLKSPVYSKPQQLIFKNIMFNADGSQFAVSASELNASSSGQNILIYATNDLAKPQYSTKGLGLKKINAMEWYGNKLIVADLEGNKIVILDPAKNQVITTVPTPSRPWSIDYNTAKNLLVVGCEDGSIYKITPGQTDQLTLVSKPTSSTILCVALNADASKIAIGTDVGLCMVLNSSGETISKLSGHRSGLTQVRFHPQTGYLLTSNRDKSVRLFTSLKSGTQPIVFSEHEDWVYDVIFHPTEKVIASCGRDKTVRLYPYSMDDVATSLQKVVNRNLTEEEWRQLVGDDVPYEKTIPNL